LSAAEELLINITPQETRVAVVENGVLQEVHIERSRSRGLVGNIYRGKVVRVLPGMQAAFIDAGLERTVFLHASDIELHQELNTEHGQDRTPPEISRLLHCGQELTIQVLKDPISSKGARVSTEISIPSRHLVYLPTGKRHGVSQRIQDETERDRLRELVQTLQQQEGVSGSYIIRTVAESAAQEELLADIRFLWRVWNRIQQRLQAASAPALIHEDIPLALRILRDLVRDSVEKIRIDSRETYQRTREFADELVPDVANRLEYYSGERPIFELYSVEDEIERALDRYVALKSGGYLVLDQTEALTTIDVNTGGFVGRRNLEETLFKTNLEATYAIARQLRLRDLGGMIIIDFIDMEDPEHRLQVMRALEKALSHDRTRTFVTEMSSLSLVEITRKRVRESLEHQLCEECPICQGRGMLKTAQTTCYAIFREILRESRQFEPQEILVLASQKVVDLLLEEESTSLADLQTFIAKPVRLQVEPCYHQEQYDVVLV